jgi:hypothetical protein
MYKICWRAKETGATECGEPIFRTKEMAQKNADDLNRKYPYLEFSSNNPYHRVTAASTPLAAAFIFYSITGGLPEIPTNGVTR